MTDLDHQIEATSATSALRHAFDTAQAGPDDGEPVEGPQRRLVGGLVLGALATALVAVLAPLQTLYTFQFEFSDGFGGGSTDRWRVTGWARTASFAGQPDYELGGIPMGLVFAVGAGVLVVGALATARPSARVVGSCLAVGGASAIITGLLVVVLERGATIDSFGNYGGSATTSTSVGTGGWLLLLATVTALLCAVLAVRLLLRSVRPPAVPATDDPADDEETDDPPEPDEPPAAPVPDARLPQPAEQDGEPSPWDSEPGWRHRPASIYQRPPGVHRPSSG